MGVRPVATMTASGMECSFEALVDAGWLDGRRGYPLVMNVASA